MLVENLSGIRSNQRYKEMDLSLFKTFLTVAQVLTIVAVFGSIIDLKEKFFRSNGESSGLSAMSFEEQAVLCAVVIFAGIILYYLFVKMFMSFWCEKRFCNTDCKILKEFSMPYVACWEALKPWQMIVSYVLPMLLIQTPLYIICLSSDSISLFAAMFFIIIITAQDIVAVVYILYLWLINKAKYICMHYYIFQMSIYR